MYYFDRFVKKNIKKTSIIFHGSLENDGYRLHGF
jgi:hypothetical protein